MAHTIKYIAIGTIIMFTTIIVTTIIIVVIIIIILPGAVIDFLAAGSASLYSEALPSMAAEMERRKARPLLETYMELCGPVFPENRNYIVFDCTVEDSEGETGVVPTIRWFFK
jgi:hypothetical protein